MFLDEFGYLPHSTSLAILYVTTRICTWLHMTARDCTWLLADFYQNIYPSTFKSHTWIDFFGLLNFSHKALVFFLSSHWIRRFFIDWSLSGFLPQFPLGWEVFYQRHDLLRLISFPTRLGCSHWSSGFLPQSFNKLGGFLPSYLHSYLYLYVWRSSRPRGKAIVMSWSRDLQITGCTWFSHVSLTITQSTHDLITSSFHPKILHASASSSLPLL